MALGPGRTARICEAERERRDQLFRGRLDLGLQTGSWLRFGVLGTGMGQDALQDACRALEQIRIRGGHQKGCAAMGLREENVASVRAFEGGGVPVWKTAGGRNDGQDQKGRQLADTLSSPVHAQHLVFQGLTRDQCPINCNRRVAVERVENPWNFFVKSDTLDLR